MNLCVWCGRQTEKVTTLSWRCGSGKCDGRTFWLYRDSKAMTYYRPSTKSRKTFETQCPAGCLFIAREEAL